MLIIDVNDIDNSLTNVKNDYLSESRFLDVYEKDQLTILKSRLYNDLYNETDSEEKKILKDRIKKVNDILEIHESFIEKTVEYLKESFSDVPDFPEEKISYDYEKFISNYYNDFLLNFKLNLLDIKGKDIKFKTTEEESVFIDNLNYLINAINYSLNLVEGVEGFSKSDYPKLYRVMEFEKMFLLRKWFKWLKKKLLMLLMKLKVLILKLIL